MGDCLEKGVNAVVVFFFLTTLDDPAFFITAKHKLRMCQLVWLFVESPPENVRKITIMHPVFSDILFYLSDHPKH